MKKPMKQALSSLLALGLVMGMISIPALAGTAPVDEVGPVVNLPVEEPLEESTEEGQTPSSPTPVESDTPVTLPELTEDGEQLPAPSETEEEEQLPETQDPQPPVDLEPATPEDNAEGEYNGTFTAVTLNVDGMPKEIKVNRVYTYNLNPDGPGAEGTVAIGQKMKEEGWDLIATSENFNFTSELFNNMSGYLHGTVRGSIPTSWNVFNLPDWPLNTDGLNLLWNEDTIYTSNESWTHWNKHYSTDIDIPVIGGIIGSIPANNGADGLIDKGYRYYEVTLQGGVQLDVYILHMDADSSPEDIAARESQITQLADAILASNTKNPILVMGDINCRYTRENLEALFVDEIEADERFTVNDPWVDKAWGGVYPTYGSEDLVAKDKGGTYEYPKAEIVDKIFYINNTNSGVTLTADSYEVDTSFTDDAGNPLADHWPVVVKFTYTYTEQGITCKHNYQEAERTLATCAEPEYITYKCSMCGATYVEEGAEATGEHQTTWVTAEEPTCTENGLKQAVCNLCHDVIGEEVIFATGHIFVDGICIICGEKEEAELPHQPYIKNVEEMTDGKYALAFNGTTGLFALEWTGNDEVRPTQVFSQNNWTNNQTWTITKEDGGYTISAEVNGDTMYLARTSVFTGSGYQIGLEKEPFVWSVTADQEMNSLRFSAHSGFSTYYLRYYSESTGWQACSRAAGLKVYKVK